VASDAPAVGTRSGAGPAASAVDVSGVQTGRPEGPAGSEVTLLADAETQLFQRDARDALHIALRLHSSDPAHLAKDADDMAVIAGAAAFLLEPGLEACERARGTAVLQQAAFEGNRRGDLLKAVLPEGPARLRLRSAPISGNFWPVQLLLREHFFQRCIAAGLGGAGVTAYQLCHGATRLTGLPMEIHLSAFPLPNSAGPADGKELSAEQMRWHRAIRAAVSRASRRASGGLAAFVTNGKARALSKEAIAADKGEDKGVSVITAALVLEPDNLFLKALRTDLRCRSDRELDAAAIDAKDLTAAAPACADAWTLYAMTLRSVNAREALASAERALALDSSLARAWWARALVFERVLNFEEAVRCFERVRQHCKDRTEMAEWTVLARPWPSYCVDTSEPGSPAAYATALRNSAGWGACDIDKAADFIQLLIQMKSVDPRVMAPPVLI
jgi:hypothetical protein